MTIYNAAGEILRVVTCPESMAAIQCGEGESSIEGSFDGGAYYISDGKPLPRPPMGLSVSGSVIYGIPPGATVTVEGQSFQVDDGTAEIAPTYPGTYRVRVSKFPYLPETVEVTV